MEPIYEEITTTLLNDEVVGDDNSSQYYSRYSLSSTTAATSYEDHDRSSGQRHMGSNGTYDHHDNDDDDDDESNENDKDEYYYFGSDNGLSESQRKQTQQTTCCWKCKSRFKCSRKMFTVSSLLLLTTMIVLVGSLIALPTLSAFAAAHHKPKLTSYYIAGLFVILTVPLSLHEIIMHLTNWYMPTVQKYVVRILFMVPIYSVQSWFSLYFQNATFYIDTVRELYEAFVISSFVYYLVALLGGEETLKITLRRKDPKHERHPWFIHWLFGNWTMGHVFLLWCKAGVLQYVVIKTIASIVVMILKGVHKYEEGKFGWKEPFTYVSTVLNLSMAFAMYCLVKFFYATKEELRSPINWRPIGKFLCIKGIVFFTWWQGFALSLLESYGIITNIGNWDSKLVAGGLQDLLICVEMLGFAVAHRYTFTHKEYTPDYVGDAMETFVGVPLGEDGNDSNGDYMSQSDHSGSRGVPMQGLGSSRQRQEQQFLQQHHQQQQQQHPENDEYNPPSIQQLDVPASVSRAIWSSAIPGEMFTDLRRLSRGPTTAATMDSNDEFLIDMKDAQSI